MSRSKNSRKGSTNKHSRRHRVCVEGPNCPYCNHNLHIQSYRALPAPDKDPEQPDNNIPLSVEGYPHGD